MSSLLQHGLDARSVQEVSTILRTVADIRELQLEDGAFVMKAPIPELDMAEWLIHRLDQPGGWAPTVQERENPSTRDFAGGVRIYYLLPTTSVQETQETLTILRTVLDVQKIFNYTPHRALAMRGTKAERDAVEWLLTAMDAGSDSAPYRLEGKPNDQVKVFSLAPGTGVTELKQLMTELRVQLRINKVFNRTPRPVFVVRGTADELDKAGKAIARFQ